MKDRIAHGYTRIKLIKKLNHRVHGEHRETLRMMHRLCEIKRCWNSLDCLIDFVLLAFPVLRNGLI